MDPQNPFLVSKNHGGDHEDSQEVLAEQAIADAGQSQAMFNYNQKLLEQKERELMESIALNYGRIREVERELGNLQLQLKLTSGPKKHALELLRKKIEAQNERVAYVRAKHTTAKATFERLDAELKQEEAMKDQLCNELNTLVQQAAKAQLDKLEELKATLEGLYSGIIPSKAVTKQKCRQQELQPGEQPQQQQRASATHQQPDDAGASGSASSSQAGSAAASTPTLNGTSQSVEEQEQLRRRQEQERQEQERRAVEERRKREAAAAMARSRHVSLGSSSGTTGSAARPSGAPPPPQGGASAVVATAGAATACPTDRSTTGTASPGRAARAGGGSTSRSEAGPTAVTAGPGGAAAARSKTPTAGSAASKQRFAGFDT